GEVQHDLPAALVVGLPHFGQAQLARGAIEQAYAKALFEQRDAPADGGFLHAQALRSESEAVAFHYAGKDQCIIQPHDCSPRATKFWEFTPAAESGTTQREDTDLLRPAPAVLSPGSNLQQALAQALDLVAQLRGSLELEVTRELEHLFLELA